MWGYWQLSLRLLLFGFAAPISIGATLLLSGYYLSRNSAELEEHGDMVRARVLESKVAEDGFWVKFEYLDEDNRLHYGESVLRGATARAVQTSGLVEIRFDRRNPAIYTLNTNGVRLMAENARLAMISLGSLLIALGFGLFLRRAWQIHRSVRLLRDGTVVSSAVRAHVREDSKKAATQFTYAYQGPNGRWYEGVSRVLPANYLDRFPVGQTVRVAFAPREPRRSEVDIFGLRRDAKE